MRPADCLKRHARFPARRFGIACSSITCDTGRENFPANREIVRESRPGARKTLPQRAAPAAVDRSTAARASGLPQTGIDALVRHIRYGSSGRIGIPRARTAAPQGRYGRMRVLAIEDNRPFLNLL